MVEACQGTTLILAFQDQYVMSQLNIGVVLAVVGDFVYRLLKRKVLSWMILHAKTGRFACYSSKLLPYIAPYG